MTLKFGLLPNDPRKPRVKLRALPGFELAPPPSANWVGSGFPVSELGMLGNDQVGDCVFAGSYHSVDVFEWNGQARTTNFTAAQVVADYATVTGYTPSNPNSDQGATLQEGLDWWMKTGNGGYKIQAYAQIDSSNLALVQSCIAAFGVVYAGFSVPQSAVQQFNSGQPWAVAGRSQIVGGHCVPLVAYDATSLSCITWAAVQKMTTQFYQRYFSETWVPISTDWLETTGLTPSGLNGVAANAQFQALTGSTAAPFPVAPVPPPPPPPSPSPSPTPTPATADVTMWAACKAWAAAKGLDVPPHVAGH